MPVAYTAKAKQNLIITVPQQSIINLTPDTHTLYVCNGHQGMQVVPQYKGIEMKRQLNKIHHLTYTCSFRVQQYQQLDEKDHVNNTISWVMDGCTLNIDHSIYNSADKFNGWKLTTTAF